MRLETARAVRVGGRTGLRTVGLAVILLAVGLLALATILSAISPLRLDPVPFGVSILIGVALSLGLILTGRSRSLPNLIDIDRPTSNY